MGEDRLRLYRTLSRAPFPKGYVGKVFLTAFFGTHLPLPALLAYFLGLCRFGLRGVLRVFSVTVPATLAGTALTIWAMNALSTPVVMVSRALRRYIDTGKLPDLPVGYTDRTGRLMADVQYTVERLDTVVRSLEEQATRAYLTDTYNRRTAEERLAEEIERSKRGGGTLSRALSDLDRLKSIIDQHGHHAGDAGLTRFAAVLGRNLRAGHWVARWGGDEFLVGIWNTQEDEQSTRRAIERILADLRQNPVPLPDGQEAWLSVSAGTCRRNPEDGVRGLISKADRALYQAKARGGNTVVHLD